MAEIVNNFLGNGMDKDANGRLIQKGMYRDMVNCRVDSGYDNGYVSKVKSTLRVHNSTTLPDGSLIIGAKEYDGWVYFFAIDDNGNDAIGRVHKTGNTSEGLVSVDYLNFSPNSLIVDIDFVDDATNNRLLMYPSNKVSQHCLIIRAFAASEF